MRVSEYTGLSLLSELSSGYFRVLIAYYKLIHYESYKRLLLKYLAV